MSDWRDAGSALIVRMAEERLQQRVRETERLLRELETRRWRRRRNWWERKYD